MGRGRKGASSASVAGAQVWITDVDTNAARTALTDESGLYTFVNLVVGTQTLRITHRDFSLMFDRESSPTLTLTYQGALIDYWAYCPQTSLREPSFLLNPQEY
jgi:hypothetical protein